MPESNDRIMRWKRSSALSKRGKSGSIISVFVLESWNVLDAMILSVFVSITEIVYVIVATCFT